MFSGSTRRGFVCAAALAIVFASRVFVGFDAVRSKLVERPIVPVASVVAVPVLLPAPPDRLSAPVALIARIQNDSSESARFSIQVDGTPVCERNVAAGRLARVDCAADTWRADAVHRIDVTGPSTPWSLRYFEASTHHGATRAHDLVIAPRGAHYDAPSWTTVVAVSLVLCAAFMMPPVRLPRLVVSLHLAGCIAIGLALGLLVASPLVSPYVLLMSSPAFVLCAAFVLAPRLWTGASYLSRQWEVSRQRPLAVAAVSGGLVLAVYGAVIVRHVRDDFGGNYSGFVQLSLARFDKDPMLKDRSDVRGSLILWDNGGYDGQFMYFEIFDPFLRAYSDRPAVYREYIDAPPYRYARIGFPLLTRIAAAGRWERYPAAMTWLILGALSLCGAFLSLVARAHGASAVWGLAVVLIPGFWTSVQCSLPEPLAAALILAGYWFFVQGRYGYSSAALALSLLVRETGAIFVVCLAGALLLSGGWKTSARFLAAALVPLVVWRLYVAWILFPDAGREALFHNTNVLGVPLGGFADLWTHISRGDYFPDSDTLARAGVVYPLLLGGGFALAIAFAIASPGPVSAAAVVYATMAISFKYEKVWSHVMNGQRTTYEMFIALAMLTVGAGARSRALRGALIAFWLGSAAYLLYGGFDAEYLRDTIFQGLL